MLVGAIGFVLPAFASANPGTDYLLRQGKEALERHDYDVAIARFSDAIKIEPNNGQIWIQRCRAYTRKGDYSRAIADCDTGVRLAPDSDDAYRRRGDVYYRNRQIEQALADFARAIQLDPHDAWNYVGRGLVRNFQQQYDSAMADFDEAIRLDPKNSDAYALRGNVFLHKGDYDRAWSDYNKAIGIEPKNAFAFSSRGYESALLFDYNAAIRDYDEAIVLDPSYEPARLYRAKAYTYRRWVWFGYFNLSLLGLGMVALVVGAWRVYRSPTALRHSIDQCFRQTEDGRQLFLIGRKGLGYEVPDVHREKVLRQFVRQSWSVSMIAGVVFIVLSFIASPLLTSAADLISANTELSGTNAILMAVCGFMALFLAAGFVAIRLWRRAVTRGLPIAPERAERPSQNQRISNLIEDMPVGVRRIVLAACVWFFVVGVLQLWQVRNGPFEAMFGRLGTALSLAPIAFFGSYLIKIFRVYRAKQIE